MLRCILTTTLVSTLLLACQAPEDFQPDESSAENTSGAIQAALDATGWTSISGQVFAYADTFNAAASVAFVSGNRIEGPAVAASRSDEGAAWYNRAMSGQGLFNGDALKDELSGVRDTDTSSTEAAKEFLTSASEATGALSGGSTIPKSYWRSELISYTANQMNSLRDFNAPRRGKSTLQRRLAAAAALAANRHVAENYNDDGDSDMAILTFQSWLEGSAAVFGGQACDAKSKRRCSELSSSRHIGRCEEAWNAKCDDSRGRTRPGFECAYDFRAEKGVQNENITCGEIRHLCDNGRTLPKSCGETKHECHNNNVQEAIEDGIIDARCYNCYGGGGGFDNYVECTLPPR